MAADGTRSRPRGPGSISPRSKPLLDSVPRLDVARGKRLRSIEGEIPDLSSLPTGCAFQPRCQYAVERCVTDDPPLGEVEPNHTSACWEWQRVALAEKEAVSD